MAGRFSESYRQLIQPLELAAAEKRFTLFTIGVGVSTVGRQVLNELSRPFGGRCLDLADLRFEQMFLWLSGSLIRVSQSTPGEQVPLVNPVTGDDLYGGWVL
jgi:uncharacterized protein YegL